MRWPEQARAPTLRSPAAFQQGKFPALRRAASGLQGIARIEDAKFGEIDVNFGVGKGFTSASDKGVLKLLVAFAIDWERASTPLRRRQPSRFADEVGAGGSGIDAVGLRRIGRAPMVLHTATAAQFSLGTYSGARASIATIWAWVGSPMLSPGHLPRSFWPPASANPSRLDGKPPAAKLHPSDGLASRSFCLVRTAFN